MAKSNSVSVTVKTTGPATVKVTVRERRQSLTVLRNEERATVGGFSEPSKMPWLSWSTPATHCKTGSKLRQVEGSTCSGCYAMKGRYVFDNVQSAMQRRFDTLADLSAWTDAMTDAITERAARYTPTADEPLPSFRWHDSGDLQSADHLAAICEVAERTQDVLMADGTVGDVEHWLPTREYGFVTEYLRRGGVIPRNLCVRLSAHMVDGPAPSKYGLPVSTVHTADDTYPEAYSCPAYTQGGKCLTCRACWDETVQHVSYPVH